MSVGSKHFCSQSISINLCRHPPSSRVRFTSVGNNRNRQTSTIWIETRLAGKTLEPCPAASLERSASGIEPKDLGLTLQDGKTVLKQVQGKMVRGQISILDTALKLCRSCRREQRVKDHRSRQLRTAFGTIDVRCRRYDQCTCSAVKPLTLSPLGVVGLKRNTPELTFLLAKWRRKVPYRRAAELLRLSSGGKPAAGRSFFGATN